MIETLCLSCLKVFSSLALPKNLSFIMFNGDQKCPATRVPESQMHASVKTFQTDSPPKGDMMSEVLNSLFLQCHFASCLA